jgi:hypothetical protein
MSTDLIGFLCRASNTMSSIHKTRETYMRYMRIVRNIHFLSLPSLPRPREPRTYSTHLGRGSRWTAWPGLICEPVATRQAPDQSSRFHRIKLARESNRAFGAFGAHPKLQLTSYWTSPRNNRKFDEHYVVVELEAHLTNTLVSKIQIHLVNIYPIDRCEMGDGRYIDHCLHDDRSS